MKTLAKVWLLLIFCLLMTACSQNGSASKRSSVILDRDSLDSPDRVVGIITGSTADEVVDREFPNVKKKYFSISTEAVQALLEDKIDAFIYDRPVLDHIVSTTMGLTILPNFDVDNHLAVAAAPDKKELMQKVNSYIRFYRDSGMHDEMSNRWVRNLFPEMPVISVPKSPSGKLVIGTEAFNPPMNFLDSQGTPIGFDVEFAQRLALYLNMECEIKVLPWDSLLMATQNGQVDLMVAQLDNTASNRSKFLLSNDYLDSSIAIAIHSNRLDLSANSAFCDSFRAVTSGSRIGVTTGSIQEDLVSTKCSDAVPVRFDSVFNLFGAFRLKEVDGVFLSYFAFSTEIRKDRREFFIMIEPDSELPLAAAVSKRRPELLSQINDVLARMEHDGTLEEMRTRWFLSEESEGPAPDVPVRGDDAPALRIATAADLKPFRFQENGELTGFDLELARRIAWELNMRPEIINTTFSSIIPSVENGLCDVAFSGLAITEERANIVLFSKPYIHDKPALLVRKSWLKTTSFGASTSPWSFLSPSTWTLSGTVRMVSDGIEQTLLREQRWKKLLQGWGTSLLITILVATIGTLFGIFLGLTSLVRNGLVRRCISSYCLLATATPPVAILMVFYYLVWNAPDMAVLAIPVFAFSIPFSAWIVARCKEQFSRPRAGQYETARSLGLSPIQYWRYILIPQVLSETGPRFLTELTTLFKATAVVGFFAIPDLAAVGLQIHSQTALSFFPLLIVTLLYLIGVWGITFSCTRLARILYPLFTLPLLTGIQDRK